MSKILIDQKIHLLSTPQLYANYMNYHVYIGTANNIKDNIIIQRGTFILAIYNSIIIA